MGKPKQEYANRISAIDIPYSLIKKSRERNFCLEMRQKYGTIGTSIIRINMIDNNILEHRTELRM